MLESMGCSRQAMLLCGQLGRRGHACLLACACPEPPVQHTPMHLAFSSPLMRPVRAFTGKGVMKSDGQPRFHTLDGKPLYHFMGTSTFSGARFLGGI